MSYTYDWFSGNIPTWSRVLIPQFHDIETHAIELGVFEGKASTWLLENVLTHKKSTLDCVDTWQGGVNDDRFDREIDWVGGERRFYENIEPWKSKVRVHKESTFEYMKHRVNPADLIYVDAGHLMSDTIIDCVQSHLLLKPSGILILDDFLWTGIESNPLTPKGAIDAFMACFSREYDLASIGYQVILKKKAL